jgi:FeS assembly SUF system regulator
LYLTVGFFQPVPYSNACYNQYKYGTVSKTESSWIKRMLRIGKLTDYALLILGQMAKMPEGVLSAAFLAETLHLGAPTVSKILKILSEAGFVTSTRGAEGGYRLARSARDITLIDVINAMEGMMAMTTCCEKKGQCAIDTICMTRDNWQKINRLVSLFLSRFSILDMMQPLVEKNLILSFNQELSCQTSS